MSTRDLVLAGPLVLSTAPIEHIIDNVSVHDDTEQQYRKTQNAQAAHEDSLKMVTLGGGSFKKRQRSQVKEKHTRCRLAWW